MLDTKAWLVVAGVNRQWRDLYAPAVQLLKETSAQHAVATVTTYEYAKLCGRDSTSAGEARLLGRLGGLDVVYRYAEEAEVAALVAAAFKHKRADILQLLHVLSPYLRPGQTCDTSLLCWAVLLGQLECLRFLTTAVGANQGSHQIRQSARSKVSCYAAKGGHVPMLQWLQQHGFLQEPAQSSQRFPGSLCDTAAQHGCADAVLWLREQGFKLGDRACAGAAEAGNLQLLLWLRSHGAHWSAEELRQAAAAGGSVEMLQFLHNTAAEPWDTAALTRMLHAAGKCGKLAAAQWLHSNGAPLPTRLWCGHRCWPRLSTLRWAIESGATWWDSEPLVWYMCGSLRDIVDADAWQWAHEHGCPCDCAESDEEQE
jgi:hypothetical protein